MEQRKIKRIRSVYGDTFFKTGGRHDGMKVDKNIEEKNLLNTLYEDEATGIQVIIYKNEIKGKITENNLDNIAIKKIEKEILKKKGLYEEIVINLNETIETLLPIDDNLVFTNEDLNKIYEQLIKNEKIKEYEDLEYSFFNFTNGYEARIKLSEFLEFYHSYEEMLNNDYFEEVDKETKEEREEDYSGDEFFLSEEFTEKSQIEKRLNDLKSIANLSFKYLFQLKNGIVGIRKTDEEMDKEYGEYDWFKMERSTI